MHYGYPSDFAYAKPLSTAASALIIDEPAAPMTAKNPVIRIGTLYPVDIRTVVTQCDKLEIKDPTLIFPYPTNTNRISSLEFPVQSWLWPIVLIKNKYRVFWSRGAS